MQRKKNDTLVSTAKLASMYRKQRWWKEADELEAQVMQMGKRVLGVKHPDQHGELGAEVRKSGAVGGD
jgi:hypothetical protein